MNIQRWVWLEVCGSKATHNAPLSALHRYYVPEEIIAHIPTYLHQLNDKLAHIEGDAEPIIRDALARDPQLVCQTIRVLASGYLTPLNEADKESKGTWDGLISLFNFSTALSIKILKVAVLTQLCKLIDTLNPAVFLAFARHYYDDCSYGSRQNTDLGCLIKVKLAEFLPRLQQTMTIKDISAEGGILGTQLIEVLLEDRLPKIPKREELN
jgi:hypothetical protein